VIFIYLFFIFHFSFFILMEHFQTFNLGVLDLGAITWSKARWSVIADQIMLRQKKYSNPFRELTIDGVEGFPLGDINPDFGIFSSTAALEKGEQLQTLYTKIRNAYQILLARLDKSGFHSAHDELVKAALERTGEGRMKDIPLFFYYMTVRNTDLKFLDSTLQKDENGEEVNIEKEPVNLSEYISQEGFLQHDGIQIFQDATKHFEGHEAKDLHYGCLFAPTLSNSTISCVVLSKSPGSLNPTSRSWLSS
jgi:hypothetical protein